MSIGTFGAFTQARLAIYAAQTGLGVTGNNISNINTEGYTRQRVDQSSLYCSGADRYYAQNDVRVGQGVLVNGISQIRNPYLDIRFRTENANMGYMDAMLGGLNSVAQVLDETGKGVQTEGEDFGLLGADFSELHDALEQLVEQTGHEEYDNQVRAAARELVKKFKSYANQLNQTYKDTLTAFKQDVATVNDYLVSIRELNAEIRKADIHGDPALELRDKRNLLIDKLSSLVDIDVQYSMEEFSYGVEIEKLTIRLGNANPDGSVETDSTMLIDGIYAAQLILEQVPQENPAAKLDPDNKDTWPYLDANGDPVMTADQAEMVKVENPDWDGKDPATQYLDKDGKPTDVNNAAEEPKANPAYMPYLDGEGNPTNDPTKAKMVDNPNFNLTVSEMRNKTGRLHYTTEELGAETEITDPAEIEAAKKAIKNGGSVAEKQDNKDILITVYRMNKAGKYFKQEYIQTASKPVELDDNDLHGGLQAERELLTEAGEFTDLEVINGDLATGALRNADENAGSKRGIPYYQKMLDALANQVANAFNAANQGFRMDPDGNYITTGVNEKGEEIGVPVTVTGMAADGTDTTDTLVLNKNTTLKDQPPEIVRRLQEETGLHYDPDKDNSQEIIDAYLKGQKYDADGNPTLEGDALKANAKGIFDGGVLFSNSNNSNDPTNITASNIDISADWSVNPLVVRSFTCPPGSTEPASGDSENILHMQGLIDEKMDYRPSDVPGAEGASGDVMFTGSFTEFWNKMGAILGADQKYSSTMLDTFYENTLSIDTSRDSVSSVDFNDEAMNLMMYAKSYNAACRLMTTLDSVLDKLINNTGLTT